MKICLRKNCVAEIMIADLFCETAWRENLRFFGGVVWHKKIKAARCYRLPSLITQNKTQR
jgi:hypothetical protein